MVQAHSYYSGFVQGVGFRFITQRLSQEYNLKGWVRNLSDGRVEILVQGPQSTIEKLFLAIHHRFQENITEQKTEILPKEDTNFVSFDIDPTL